MKTKQHEMENISVAELLLLLILSLLLLLLSFFIYLFIFGVWEFRFWRVKRQRQMREKISKRLLSILRTALQHSGQNIARGNDPVSYAGHHWMSYSG